MAATKTATKPVESNGAFVLNDSELGNLIGQRGRKATDSIYLAEMKEAISNPAKFEKGTYVSGLVAGVKCTATRKGPYIEAQLRKAGKQLGLATADFQVLNRSENTSQEQPFGFVAYFVKAKDAA